MRGCPNPKRLPNHGTIDTREMLKSELAYQDQMASQGIGYNDGLSFTSQFDTNVAKGQSVTVNDNYGFGDSEIYFDSRYRNRTSDIANGEVSWNLTVLNNNTEISNIVQIHIDNFFFPKILTLSTKPEFFYYRKIYMELDGTSSQQAIQGPNGQRFHFEFDVENLTGQAVLLRPVKNSFFFESPLNSLAAFQLRFMVPQTRLGVNTMKRIPIPNEEVVIRSLTTGGFGYNPIRFEILGLDTTSVLGLIGSLGVPGVAVFISGYGTNDPAVNALINDGEGIFATTVIDATTFEIAGINATTVSAQYQAIMLIPKNRIAIPFRFTSVRNRITNHMDVGHL